MAGSAEVLILNNDPALARRIEEAVYGAGYDVALEPLDGEITYTDPGGGATLAFLAMNGVRRAAVVERIRQFRRASLRTPLMVIAPLHDREDRVRALQEGADEALALPYHEDEMLARFLAVLRRAHSNWDKRLRIGRIVLNLDARTARVDRETLPLSLREFHLLEILALRPGVYFKREDLFDRLYAGDAAPSEPRAVDLLIDRVRRRMLRTFGASYIAHAPGLGYVLKAPPA